MALIALLPAAVYAYTVDWWTGVKVYIAFTIPCSRSSPGYFDGKLCIHGAIGEVGSGHEHHERSAWAS
jgi:hypothetical protein